MELMRTFLAVACFALFSSSFTPAEHVLDANVMLDTSSIELAPADIISQAQEVTLFVSPEPDCFMLVTFRDSTSRPLYFTASIVSISGDTLRASNGKREISVCIRDLLNLHIVEIL